MARRRHYIVIIVRPASQLQKTVPPDTVHGTSDIRDQYYPLAPQTVDDAITADDALLLGSELYGPHDNRFSADRDCGGVVHYGDKILGIVVVAENLCDLEQLRKVLREYMPTF